MWEEPLDTKSSCDINNLVGCVGGCLATLLGVLVLLFILIIGGYV